MRRPLLALAFVSILTAALAACGDAEECTSEQRRLGSWCDGDQVMECWGNSGKLSLGDEAHVFKGKTCTLSEACTELRVKEGTHTWAECLPRCKLDWDCNLGERCLRSSCVSNEYEPAPER